MTNDAIIYTNLGDVTTDSAGYPLRGSAESLKAGDVRLMQLKNVANDGDMNWGDVTSISLPSKREPSWLTEKLFYGTGIPAAILVFRKNKTYRNTLFIAASREFVSGKNQNQLSEGNITKIIATYQERKTVDKYAYLATAEEMAKNDYNLNIPRYVDTFEEEEEIDLMAVRAERMKLKAELAELEKKMDGYLKELGYAIWPMTSNMTNQKAS